MKNLILSHKRLSVTLTVILIFLFVAVPLVFAYAIRNIYFSWSTNYSGSIVMNFDVTGNYHWVTSGRLLPLPEQNFGTWPFGAINGWENRYMVTGALMGETYRICLGVSDTDPGSGDILYDHPNNRCFRVWRDTPSTVNGVEIFNIYGHIVDGNSQPLGGVSVSDGVGHTAVTDGNGDFSFYNLDNGSYTLTPSKTGYTFSPASRAASGGPPYHATGNDFTGTNLSSISGRIIDGAGTPISGVTVADTAGHTANTDVNGNYTLSGIAPGTYTVTPSKNGYLFSPASRQVNVPPDATGQNFNVTNRYSISGQVADNGGNGISGVPVTCITWPLQTVIKTAITDGTGHYVFSELSFGFYMIRSAAGSLYTLSPVVRGPLLLPPGAIAQNFTTTPVYGMVNGKVTAQNTGQPIAGAVVNAGGKLGTTNGSGDFNIANVLPGTHNINISANGYAAYQSQVSVQANASTYHSAVLTPLRADGYRLPYPGGANYMCTQGNDSGFSHTGSQRYAFDFGITYNAVVASRAGRVIAVKTDGTPCGYWSQGNFICSNACLNSANFVKIRHSDNTDSLYVHLSRVDVTVGTQVATGQQIGVSGSTGCSTGSHLHFHRYNAGQYQTIQTPFLDVSSNGGIPQSWQWYTSDNYRALFDMVVPTAVQAGDTEPPVGGVQFRMTAQPTYTLRLWAADYASDNIQMRLSATVADLNGSAWQTFTDTVSWPYPEAWVQYQDPSGNISAVYSDTLDSIVYEPIQAAFQISPTVCVGQVPQITNQTTPYCEQCGWNWDLGDGNRSSNPEPSLPYPYTGYLSPGLYTVTLTVSNAESVSSVVHPVQAIWGPSSAFTVTQSGSVVTVTAWETNANSWQWTHTYAGSGVYPVQLTVNGNSSCQSSGLGYISVNRIYLPVVMR